MSAHDAFLWTLTILIWIGLILPIVLLCGCMTFIVISNHFQARRLGKAPPGWGGGGEVVELHRTASSKPQMVLIRDPKEPA